MSKDLKKCITKAPTGISKVPAFEMPCAGRVPQIPFQLVNAFNVLYCSTFRIDYQVDCTLSSKVGAVHFFQSLPLNLGKR